MDKNFCDDHCDRDKLLANSTGNDKPIKDVIGAHSFPPSSLAGLTPQPTGGRVLMRDTKETRGRTPAHTESRCPIANTSSDPLFVPEVHIHSTSSDPFVVPGVQHKHKVTIALFVTSLHFSMLIRIL